MRVSDLDGTPITDPNVNSSSVLFQVKFTEAVRRVDITDFVPVGSAVISGVRITDFAIANNAISFTDVNGVTYADTYVYTVSGLDGLSGNLGLALSQGVNGITDVDSTSLITTAPPQGQNLDQTYTINNISTTIFVSVVASDADAREDGDPGEYVITRTGDLTNSLTVDFSFTGGTASPDDFQVFDSNNNLLSSTGGSVTIAANQTSTTIRIVATDDIDTENSETLRLVISPSANYTVQSVASAASVFISDSLDLQGDDLPIPRISITASDPIADEATGDRARFVINIAGNDDAFANPDGLSISIVAGGSAVIGEDYVIENAGGIRFSDLAGFIGANLTGLPVGVDQVGFSIIPIRDFVAGNRTVTFTIQSSNQNPAPGQADYTVGTPLVAGATILDVDAPIAIPDISIVASDPVGSEANKETITFTLTRTTASTGPVTVFLQVGGDATAFEGELPPPSDQLLPEGTDYITDYQVTGGLIAVTFNEGETLKTITITPVDDLDLDNGFTDEVISLSILPSAFYTISDNATATGVIVNDEEPAIVIIDPVTEVSEGGLRTFTVRIDGNAIGQDLNITFNVEGSATNPNLLADATGSTDTGVDAGDDYFIPGLSIETEDDAFGNTRVITTAPTVVIAAGSTSATFTVQTIDDGLGLDDDGETVIINLTAGEGYVVGTQNESTLTIRDINDRGTVTLAVTDGTAAETDQAIGTYTLERVGDNLQAVDVTFDITGTAIYGDDKDYTITAIDASNAPIPVSVSNDGVLTLTLPAITSPSYNTSANPQVIRINVVPNDDSIRDNTTNTAETVILTLQESSSGLYSIRDGETTGTVNLVDNDPLIPPTISLTLDSTSLIEGGGVTTATFSITLEGGNIFDTAIPISFTLGGTATRALGTALGDYTLTDGVLGTDLGSSIIFSASELVDANNDDRIDSVTKTVVVTVQSDAVGFNDDSETVQLTLIDGSGYDLSTDAGDVTSGTVTLFDRTDQGTISVSVTDNIARERNPNDAQDVENPGTFTLTRTGDNLNTALSVTFKLDGTAGLGQSPSDSTALQTQDYYITATGATLVTNSDGTVAVTSDGLVTLNFAAATTETTTQQATITVLPLYDLAFEGGVETVNLTLQAATNGSYSLPLNQLGTVNTTLTTGTVNLVDDEVALPPTVTIVAIDEIAGEVLNPTAAANVGRFRVYRGIYDGTGDQTLSSNYTNQGNTQLLDLTVNFTTSGNATAGTDYINNLGSSAVIAGGQNYVDVILSPIDDAIANDNSETVTLTLTNGAPNYLLGDTDAVPTTATVTILDNDGNAPSVTVSATDASASEQGTNYGVFEIERSEDDNLSSAVTVNFTLSGIALPTTDYLVFVNGSAITLDANQVGSVTFAANDTSETIEIRPVSDTLPESNETVTLSLNPNPTSYTLSTTETAATLIITDAATTPTNRVVPEVTVSALDPTASEVPQGTAAFLITFDGNNATTNPDENLEIAIEIGGTATIGRDYYITSPEIVATNQPFTTIGAIGGIFNIPSDYIGINGVNTVTLYVTPFDDQEFDPDETVTLRILPSTETNTPSNFADYTLGSADEIVATVTITDNDTVRLPNITITATDPTAGEDLTPEVQGEVAEGIGTFTISRDGTDLSQPLTVSYTISGTATANSDYVSIANSVTIQPGATSATVTITPLDDSNATEGNETVILTLTSPSTNLYTFGSLSSAAVTILDDDNPTAVPFVTVDNFARDQDGNIVTTVIDGNTVNVLDGASELTLNQTRDLGRFTFTRSETNLNQSLTVNFLVGGTASSGVDYESIPTSITFSANERTKTIVFTPIDDTTPDADETVTIALQSSVNYTIGDPTTGANSIATATIVDNEVIPTISISASGTELIEGGAAITYTVTRVAGSSGSPLTVNFALSGNAQRTTDYNFTSGLTNPTSDSSITLAANETTKTFTIVAASDGTDLIDDGEQVTLTLAESTNYLIPVFLTDNPLTTQNEALDDNPATAGIDESDTTIQTFASQVTLTIRDRTDTGNIQLTSTDLLGGEEPTGVEDDSNTPQDESINAIVFTLTRSGDNLQIISVPFTITGESSTADYTIDIYTYDANGVVTKVEEDQESTIFNTSTGLITLPSFGTSPFDPALTNGVLTPQIIEIHFNPVDDAIIDSLGGVETLTLTLTESTNATYTVGSALTTTQVSLTGSIQDNNDTESILPIVEVVATDAEAFEGDVTSPNGLFTFSLKDSEGNAFTATEALTINFNVTDSTATPGSESAPQDYLSLGTSITIAAGSSTATLIVEPQDDNEAGEALETVRLTVEEGNYIQSTTLNSAVVTIADNEPPPFTPTVAIATQLTPASESPVGTGVFRISRTLNGEESAAPFLENIAVTVGGNASVNTDYSFSLRTQDAVLVPISGALTSLNIPAGDSYIDVVVTPQTDTVVDPNETVTLTLSGGSSTTYEIDPDSPSASLTIQDANRVDGVTVSIELASGLVDGDSITEESQAVNAFIVRRFGGDDTRRLAQALTVNLTIGGTATAGTDYASIPSTVVIPIGVDEVSIPLTPIGDTIADTGGDESVQISIAPIANNSYRVALDEEVNPALDTDVVNETLAPATVFIIDNENNAPELDASFLDSFSVVEDSAAVELTSPSDSNQTFAQLIQQAFTDEDTAIPENDNETLRSIRFVTLPASGRLTLNGAAITLNQVVEFATAAAISSVLANLRYQPNANFFGQSSDLVAQPDRFTVVANDGFANSRETPVIINVLPVNDAPSYILPGETGFVIDPDFVSDNRASLPNFALLPGSSVQLPNFVQGISVGPSNEGVSTENSPVPNGNQTPAFTVEPIIGDSYIFTSGGAPTIDSLGTLRFTLRQDIEFGTAQVRISVKDNGGTANNGIDTLTKGFFIVTADANTLGNVITDFESTPGQTGGLIYNTTALPLGSAIRTTLTADVRQLGTSASFDNIVGLYEIADPNGGIDLGRDLDGDGDIDTNEERLAKDGIADITPNANMTATERTSYARAALQSHVSDLSLFNLRAGSNGDAVRNTTSAQFNAQGQSTTGSQQGVVLEAGKLYAPFIIANGGSLISGNGGTIAGGVSSFITVVNPNNLDTNPNSVSDPVAYFSFSEVNPDRSEHLRSIGNNVYGFEDLPGGGDRDFNDAIFSFTFNTTVVA